MKIIWVALFTILQGNRRV